MTFGTLTQPLECLQMAQSRFYFLYKSEGINFSRNCYHITAHRGCFTHCYLNVKYHALTHEVQEERKGRRKQQCGCTTHSLDIWRVRICWRDVTRHRGMQWFQTTKPTAAKPQQTHQAATYSCCPVIYYERSEIMVVSLPNMQNMAPVNSNQRHTSRLGGRMLLTLTL